MFHVITGGSGSGKSAYAEGCIVQLHKECLEQNADTLGAEALIPLYYIATMMPFGAEMEAKIDRHRKMRAGKGFETVECYMDFYHAMDNLCTSFQSDEGEFNQHDMVDNVSVLLECMSNLVANEWFAYVQEHDNCFSAEDLDVVIDNIWSGVLMLLNHCKNIVIVTNEVFSECQEDAIEMDCYKQILAAINGRMAAVADRVTEVVYGIPVAVK